MLKNKTSFGSLSTNETPIPLNSTLNLDSFFIMLESIILARIEDPFSFYKKVNEIKILLFFS
jgi:hypothetical protein